MGVQMLWPNEGMQVLSSSAKKLRLRAIKKSCARFLHAARRKGWKQSPFCNPRKTRVTSTSRSAAASRLTARRITVRPAGFGAISTSIQLSSNVQRIQTATLNGLLVGVGVEHAFTSHRTGRSSWNTTTSGMVRGNVNLICSEPASLSLPVTSVFSGGQSSVEEALVSACKRLRQA